MTDTKPACWCAYGTEGGEFTRFSHPGCPTHDPQNTPTDSNSADGEPIECDTCQEGEQDCGCDGDPDCSTCGGTGYCIPDHCCACGGSPYCTCCSKCGSPNAGTCSCTITIQRADGTTTTL